MYFSYETKYFLFLQAVNNKIFNPYSVFTPLGGFIYFSKIINLLNISLFTACINKKIFDFIRKHNIIRDDVRVKYFVIFLISKR